MAGSVRHRASRREVPEEVVSFEVRKDEVGGMSGMNFPGSGEHLMGKGSGNPEAGFVPKDIQQRGDGGNEPSTPGFDETTQRAGEKQSAAGSDFPCGKVVKQQECPGILHRQSKAFSLSRMHLPGQAACEELIRRSLMVNTREVRYQCGFREKS